MQNGFIERFNRSYRDAVLDMFVFQSLSEVREQTEWWLKECNEERPHESLSHLTPREYLLTQNAEISSNSWV
jgi:putative transposase